MKEVPADASPLDPPNSYVFSVRECAQAYRLNQFAIGLKSPDRRAVFLEDERGTMAAAGLTEGQIESVLARDWTALVACGGHVLAVVKIAYALGILHHEVCAHMCGMDYDQLRALLPREAIHLPGQSRHGAER